MRRARECLLLGVLCGAVTAGCGSVGDDEFDAAMGPEDAMVIDAATELPDAAPTPDAAPGPDAPIPATIISDVTAGGKRVSGAVYTLDVQVGHGYGPATTTGSVFTVENVSAIKP